MLHVRVLAPAPSTDEALALLRSDPTVCDVAVLRGAGLDGAADLILFDVARESANDVLATLTALDIPRHGSISLQEPMSVLSRAADEAERAAPGHPADAVVWNQLEETSRADARASWSFLVFLVLAALIASIGRYLDQPILIIGAMVVGPEFAPIAAICFGLARRRRSLIPQAAGTLLGGFALAAAASGAFWLVLNALGVVSHDRATTGELTDFIVSPDAWSFVIALLAGVAGTLSLTASKSSALVGVFISITTVPAVGTIGLTLAVGAWDEAVASLVQLGLNLAGLLIAGTATLAVQFGLWRHAAPARSGDLRP